MRFILGEQAMLQRIVILLAITFIGAINVSEANAECDNFNAEAPAIAWGSTVSKEDDKITEEFSRQITFYYQNKDINKVKEMIKNLNRIPNNQLLTSLSNQGAFRAFGGFFMGIIVENPNFYNAVRQQGNTDDVNYLLDDAFLISSQIEFFLKKSQNLCLDQTTLDMFWGYFFATGDKRAVEAIKTTANRAEPCKKDKHQCITTYCKKEGCTKDNLKLFASDLSAEWSLKSNAKTHPLVKEVLEE